MTQTVSPTAIGALLNGRSVQYARGMDCPYDADDFACSIGAAFAKDIDGVQSWQAFLIGLRLGARLAVDVVNNPLHDDPETFEASFDEARRDAEAAGDVARKDAAVVRKSVPADLLAKVAAALTAAGPGTNPAVVGIALLDASE